MHPIALPLSVLVAALPFLTGSGAQSLSESLSQSPTISAPSGSSTAGGGGGGQSGGAGSQTFQLQDYLTFLNSSGYTSLSRAIEQADQTQNGQEWIAQLSNGNWTVFAPTNDAFSSVSQDVSGNASTLADYLSYHYVYGDLHNVTASRDSGGSGQGTSSSTSQAASAMVFPRQQGQGGGGQNNLQLLSSIYPNDTIGRTALSSPQFVRLEGDKNQVLGWTRNSPSDPVYILNQMSQNGNTTVNNGTRWRNLAIFEVDGVFVPPGNLSTALSAVGDTPLVAFGDRVHISGPGGSNATAIQTLNQARGFTLFAPASRAFTSQVNQTLQSIQSDDQDDFRNAFQNHYVNGSTVYSPTLREYAANSTTGDDDNWPRLISAAGEPFIFQSNDTGLYVRVSDDATARIVRSDILVENGVVHLVDGALISTDDSDDTASSAFASASSAAAQTSTDTRVIIFPTPTGGVARGSPTGSVTGTAISATPSSFRIRRALKV
ncbi:hypothetical protein CC1G_05847 [Coprinopsis cinerea okayama7|uniref:FAS1 domain-containing protein n=1 Tax=Coprinopsis cinerea (strain Okayama-7 / 130 / ATCC MYA-4618 / FGSC 9003) TaxID=240176 RepID=A8NLK4_COPC7|nr:hypothetical protein CC1G_05847 [Coprinopsis cinerea okayama7\|eukprot:XP_001834710.1 hypothetical protein CC1G_05847 [Coprinopsis cinerea okayama7\